MKVETFDELVKRVKDIRTFPKARDGNEIAVSLKTLEDLLAEHDALRGVAEWLVAFGENNQNQCAVYGCEPTWDEATGTWKHADDCAVAKAAKIVVSWVAESC